MSSRDDIGKLMRNVVGFASAAAFLVTGHRNDLDTRAQPTTKEHLYEIPPYNLLVPSSSVEHYQAHPSPYGGLVLIVGDRQIGSAFNSRAYKASVDKFGKWMTEPELEVALALEDRVRETRKHLGPRVYSGLDAHSHIVMNFEIALENFIEANVRPDYVALLTTLAIDLVEDHQKVIQAQKGWEKAVINFDEPGRMQKEKELLTAIRDVLYLKSDKQEEQGMQDYLTKIVEKMGINGSEKKDLIDNIADVVRLTGHVTRHPWRAYPISMAFQFDKRGPERLPIVIARMGGKIADRTSNNLDIGPALSYEEFMELQRAFSENPTIAGYKLGQFLSEKYGEFRLGRYMPPAVRVGNGVNNVSILHPLNTTLNQIHGQIGHGTREEELLRWLEYSKVRMIQSALVLASSANAWYEAVLPQEFIQSVNEKEERKRRSNFYNALTSDGFFMDWVGYDIAGRRYIEAFDALPERRAKTYEDARDLQVVLSMFGMFAEKSRKDEYGRPILITDPKVKFDPARHEHFTLDLMEERLKDVEGVNYINMARRWLPYKLERNGRDKYRAVQLQMF